MPIAPPLILGPVAAELRQDLSASPDRDLAAFYAARRYRPLWVRGRALDPAADGLLETVRQAAGDDLDPEAYHPERLAALIAAAHRGGAAALARADLELSETLAAYGSDLHRPKPGVRIAYTDPALQPAPWARSAILAAAGEAPAMGRFLPRLERMNPVYEGLKRELAAAPAAERPLIRINLERARALPPSLGQRYVWVNVPAERLMAYDHGRLVGSMPVIIGKLSEPTPTLAGLIRFAVLRPYWNIPPDLVRDSVAPKVLAEGPAYLAAHHFEALSDWSPQARVLQPQGVDWSAVAAGRQTLRMRQLPGPDNMMGQVKFMFPNRFGVYLHDTPLKGLFAHDQRTFSSGCVRLWNAPWLASWLLGKDAQPQGAGAAQRVNLPGPTPVYVVYFTALPGPQGLQLRPDVYGRDRPLADSLKVRSSPSAIPVSAPSGAAASATR